jgi:hypothetical protein
MGECKVIEKISYEGMSDCYRIFNEFIELIVTTTIGPRIICFRFLGTQNEFVSTISPWGIAGHRLWHAPEKRIRTYIPDDNPISCIQYDGFVRLTQPTETASGIQKELDIPISPVQNHITIIHRLYNRGLWPVELAPWAVSAMATGGKAIMPLPPRHKQGENSLVPTSMMSIWDYSDVSDPRLTLGAKYIMLSQNAQSQVSLKIGLMDTDGWVAYYNKNHLFVVTFKYENGAIYPDLGSSVEGCSSNVTFELERLAPLKLLQSDTCVEYQENWSLFKDIPEPFSDVDIDRDILPLIKP